MIAFGSTIGDIRLGNEHSDGCHFAQSRVDVPVFSGWAEIGDLKTNSSWKRLGRQRIPRSAPAAFIQPPEWEPSAFPGRQASYPGIPLYDESQTKNYTPTEWTRAVWDFYDIFVRRQERSKYGTLYESRWPLERKYLSEAEVRRHLSDKTTLASFGNLFTNYVSLDADCHGGDKIKFGNDLDIIAQVPDFFPDLKWFWQTNRKLIRGAHLIGVSPVPLWLNDIVASVREALEGIQKRSGHFLGNLEVFPNRSFCFRLPFASDRLVITDKVLDMSDEVARKENLIDGMKFLKDPNREGVPHEVVVESLKKRAGAQVSQKADGHPCEKRFVQTGFASAGEGMGDIEPLKGRCLKFLVGVVTGKEQMPPDTIGKFIGPALRHLILVDGLSAREAEVVVNDYCERIPDHSFSDRLSDDRKELDRVIRATAKKVEVGNLYQSDPEKSSRIFETVKAHCDRIGFRFSDRSTWHVLDRPQCNFDVFEADFSLTFSEKLAIKEHGLDILKCDIYDLYQTAHRIKAFIIKYPGRELPGSMVPALCQGLAIDWFIPSDHRRCKRAEAFLELMCELGIITVVKERSWCGKGHPENRATLYGLPRDEASSFLGNAQTISHECIYITDRLGTIILVNIDHIGLNHDSASPAYLDSS